MKTGRSFTRDGKAGHFVNDAAINATRSRPERAGYGALRLAGKA